MSGNSLRGSMPFVVLDTIYESINAPEKIPDIIRFIEKNIDFVIHTQRDSPISKIIEQKLPIRYKIIDLLYNSEGYIGGYLTDYLFYCIKFDDIDVVKYTLNLFTKELPYMADLADTLKSFGFKNGSLNMLDLLIEKLPMGMKLVTYSDLYENTDTDRLEKILSSIFRKQEETDMVQDMMLFYSGELLDFSISRKIMGRKILPEIGCLMQKAIGCKTMSSTIDYFRNNCLREILSKRNEITLKPGSMEAKTAIFRIYITQDIGHSELSKMDEVWKNVLFCKVREDTVFCDYYSVLTPDDLGRIF